MRDHMTLSPLAPARVHEVCGPSAVGFVLMQGAGRQGPVIWGSVAHMREWVMPPAAARILSPERLMAFRAGSQAELLWATEEALRAGVAGLVVAVVEKSLSLTAGRRLQLAAEAGRTTGVLIIPEDGGSNAAETRWHCAPVWDTQDSTRQCWSLIKNKKGTIGDWTVCWDEKARAVRVVAATGQRPVVAGQPL